MARTHNQFSKITVASASFPTNPQVVLILKGMGTFTLVNEGNNVVEYSFDGTNVHGDMTPDTSTAAMSFSHRKVDKIWFRAASGSNVVRFEAWTEV